MRAPSRRQPTPHWMRPVTERLSPTITFLVVANALIFAFYALVKPARVFVDSHLALSGPGLLSGEVWQPFTSLFVHIEPIGFFFGMLGLWFVGATIERELGRRRFLTLYFVPAVVGNVVMAVLSTRFGPPELFAGSGAAVLALFVAFGKIYGRTPARVFGSLVLEARVLTGIFVAFALLMDLSRGALPALAGDVVSVLLAYVMAGGRGAFVRSLFDRMRGKGGGRRRLQVMEGGRRRSGAEEKRSRYLN